MGAENGKRGRKKGNGKRGTGKREAEKGEREKGNRKKRQGWEVGQGKRTTGQHCRKTQCGWGAFGGMPAAPRRGAPQIPKKVPLRTVGPTQTNPATFTVVKQRATQCGWGSGGCPQPPGGARLKFPIGSAKHIGPTN